MNNAISSGTFFSSLGETAQTKIDDCSGARLSIAEKRDKRAWKLSSCYEHIILYQ
jgi:hypothetical protein